MTQIAAAIRRLYAARSNAVQEWTLGAWVIRYNCGFVAWRRKWEPAYPIGWDAVMFLDELYKKG
jgi:hypothetical protein